MAMSAATFQNQLASNIDEMTSVLQAVETWAGNKADANATFDFAGANNTLNLAITAFEAAIAGITSL